MVYREQNGMPRGRLIFICTWLGIFAVAFLIWALFLGGITKDLAKYEEYQPVYAADSAFREHFSEASAEDLISYADVTVSEYDTEEAVLKCLELLISGKELTYRQKGADDTRYEVLASGVTFAEFSVVPDENTKELFGSHGYKLGEIVVSFPPEFKAVIIAPKNAVVKVNGKVIGEEHRVGEYRELSDAVYFPDNDPDSRFMAEYHIGELYAAPTVTVTDIEGKTVYGVEYSKTSSVYDTEYSYRSILEAKFNGTYVEPETPIQPPVTGETEIDKAYADFLNEAISVYEKYRRLPNDQSASVSWRVLAYFKPGTEIYSLLMNYYYDSNFYPDNYEFSNIKISNFSWTDATQKEFTCVYEMDSSMWKSGNSSKVDEKIAYKLTVDVSGDKYLISSLTKNN